MDQEAKIRSTAAFYVEQHGEHAVEVIRELCVRIHRAGDSAGFEVWRRIGVEAETLLARAPRARRRAGC